MYALYETLVVDWNRSNVLNTITLSNSGDCPFQFDLIRLKRRLKVVGCKIMTGCALTQIDWCTG